MVEQMGYEFNVISLKASAIALKKNKFETLQMIIQSDIKLSDEKEAELKQELVTLAESILSIQT
jgi:hypothetical protein